MEKNQRSYRNLLQGRYNYGKAVHGVYQRWCRRKRASSMIPRVSSIAAYPKPLNDQAARGAAFRLRRILLSGQPSEVFSVYAFRRELGEASLSSFGNPSR